MIRVVGGMEGALGQLRHARGGLRGIRPRLRARLVPGLRLQPRRLRREVAALARLRHGIGLLERPLGPGQGVGFGPGRESIRQPLGQLPRGLAGLRDLGRGVGLGGVEGSRRGLGPADGLGLHRRGIGQVQAAQGRREPVRLVGRLAARRWVGSDLGLRRLLRQVDGLGRELLGRVVGRRLAVDLLPEPVERGLRLDRRLRQGPADRIDPRQLRMGRGRRDGDPELPLAVAVPAADHHAVHALDQRGLEAFFIG